MTRIKGSWIKGGLIGLGAGRTSITSMVYSLLYNPLLNTITVQLK